MANPVSEFLKEAGFWDNLKAGWRGAKAGGLGGAIGEKMPAALVAGGIAGVGLGLSKGFDFIMDRVTKARDYKAMIQSTPDLHHFDASHTQMMYNSLRSLAPTLAKDPLVAGSFVRDMLRLSPEHGPAIPPATAKMLVDAQGRMEGEGIMQQMTAAGVSAKPSMRMDTPERPQMQAPYTETRKEFKPGVGKQKPQLQKIHQTVRRPI